MTEMRKKKGYRIRKLGKAAISLMLSLALSACGGNTPAIQSGGTESTAETLLSTEAEPASETELESLPVLTIESEEEESTAAQTPEESRAAETLPEESTEPAQESVPPSAEDPEESLSEASSADRVPRTAPEDAESRARMTDEEEIEITTETPTQPPTQPPTAAPTQTSFNEVSAENLEAYCRYRVAQYGLYTPRDIYLHMFNYFSYRYRDRLPDKKAMAARLFNNGNGPCYDIAYATAYLLRAAGYRCYVVKGVSRSNAGEHNWVIVEMSPGVWRYMDTLWGRAPLYNLTDEELQAYDNTMGMSFMWDTSYFTTHSSTGLGPAWGDQKPAMP